MKLYSLYQASKSWDIYLQKSISHYHLSSVPKLTNLSICDAVLTSYSFDMFKAPKTHTDGPQKLLALNKRSYLLFKKNQKKLSYHYVKITHKLKVLPFEENEPHHSPPSWLTSKTMQAARLKKELTSLSPNYVDQMVKYSRDVLFALQFMYLPLPSNSER